MKGLNKYIAISFGAIVSGYGAKAVIAQEIFVEGSRMRGGTHLLLMLKNQIEAGEAPFDLMVDDLHATHKQYEQLGLSPSAIEARPEIDHKVFTVQEPAGYVITIFSNHASGKPI